MGPHRNGLTPMTENPKGAQTPHPGAPPNTVPPHTVTDWSDTFHAAQQWVTWTGRRRYPNCPTPDIAWAMSIEAWANYGRAAA